MRRKITNWNWRTPKVEHKKRFTFRSGGETEPKRNVMNHRKRRREMRAWEPVAPQDILPWFLFLWTNFFCGRLKLLNNFHNSKVSEFCLVTFGLWLCRCVWARLDGAHTCGNHDTTITISMSKNDDSNDNDCYLPFSRQIIHFEIRIRDSLPPFSNWCQKQTISFQPLWMSRPWCQLSISVEYFWANLALCFNGRNLLASRLQPNNDEFLAQKEIAMNRIINWRWTGMNP